MNILYLAHRIPFPPDKGDKLRSFRELEYLSRRHRVWCACFVDTPSDEQFVGPLRAYCQDVAAIQLNRRWAMLRGMSGLLRGGTVTESFYTHTAMQDALHRWRESVRFDAVVVFSSSMAPYALQVPADRRVLDLCDLDSQKWFQYAKASRGPTRWLYRVEGRHLARSERTWIDIFDATLLITEAEAAALDGAVRPGKVHIVGNGVSLPKLDKRDGEEAAVTWTDQASSATDVPNVSSQRPVVGFVGVMDYQPNIDAVCWFVSECWHDIRAARPDAVFRIVGRSPTRRVHKLAAATGVQVVGAVDDVMKEVRRFDVSVAPMRIARGLQNKVLEAMAAAKPVVLTGKAATGIAGQDGREFLIADHPTDIVVSVVRLLGDQAARRRIGLSARRFVAVNHSWEETLRMFELVVTGILERTTRRLTLHPTPAPARTGDPVASTTV